MIVKSIFDCNLYGTDEKNLENKIDENLISYKIIELTNTDRSVLKKIYGLGLEGISVIIDSPERIKGVSKDVEFINDLIDYNCLFILNIDSLKGKNGTEAKKVAKKLIKNNIYNFVYTNNNSNRNVKSIIDKCSELEGISISSANSLYNGEQVDFHGRKIKKSFFGL